MLYVQLWYKILACALYLAFLHLYPHAINSQEIQQFLTFMAVFSGLLCLLVWKERVLLFKSLNLEYRTHPSLFTSSNGVEKKGPICSAIALSHFLSFQKLYY